NITAQPYYFRHYQVENGLSNNTVYCTLQDSTGFLWFGTKEGLNRFDGYKFKQFKFHSKETEWAERELIYCLSNDNQGRLWVGTQKGLYSFDKEKEKLVPWFPALTEINAIQTDRKGRLWFISATTIHRYNPKDKSLKKFPPDIFFNASSVCISPLNEIWFSSTDGKLQRYNEVTETFVPYDVYAHSPAFVSCSIEKILFADDQTIYIGTTCQGIKELNTKTGVYKDLLIYNPDKTPVYVRDILKYNENEFWFATESGIFILDRKTNLFTHVKKKFLDPYSLNDNAIYGLCKDKEGGVWAGTYFGGINYYTKQYTNFQKLYADNSNDALKGSAIREITEDRFGNLWIGTEDAGLNKIDSKTGHITNFSPDGIPGSISYSNIHGLLATGDQLWIGTHEHGLDIMDIPSGKVTRHFNEGRGDGQLKNGFVISLLETKDKNVYVGTGNSIHLFNKDKQTFSRCPQVPDHLTVSTMIEAHDKTIWAGTHGSGVYFFNPYTGESGQFQNDPRDPLSLTGNTINALLEDSDSNIWIATEGGGAIKISPDRRIVD
ncbi:MAG: hybrid sensor histidine kinase/response regulator, partial [Chitinophagaceae bacterium]